MKKDKFEIIDQTYQETVVVDSFFEKPIESLIEIETETVSPSTGESTVEQEAELSGSEVVSPELLVEETSLEYQPEETSSETTQLLAMIEEQPIEVNLAGTSDLGEIQPEVALVELLDEEDPLVLATTSLALPWWKRIWRYESKQDNGVLTGSTLKVTPPGTVPAEVPEPEEKPSTEVIPSTPSFTLDDVRTLVQAELIHTQDNMTRMVQTELVRQQHDRRHMLLNSVQEMTDSVYTTKAELFHMETKALQVEGQDTLQDRSRPLSERMEDMDYIYERVAKAEQGIILVEAATIRRLAGETHEPAEMTGDVPTLALRQELEQQKEAIVAFPTLISQTVEAKLAALPRPKVTYLGLWSTVLAVFILLGFTVSQVYFYTRIQKINSNQIPLLTQLAEENLTSDNPEAAIPLLEQIADLDPGNISVLTKLGDAYLAKRQFANAIGAYNEAVKVDNSNFAALNGLGWSYLLAGQSAQAIPVLEKAVNIRANASSLTALGRAYAEKGRCEQAQPYLKKALELQPDRQDALDTLAVCGD